MASKTPIKFQERDRCCVCNVDVSLQTIGARQRRSLLTDAGSGLRKTLSFVDPGFDTVTDTGTGTVQFVCGVCANKLKQLANKKRKCDLLLGEIEKEKMEMKKGMSVFKTTVISKRMTVVGSGVSPSYKKRPAAVKGTPTKLPVPIHPCAPRSVLSPTNPTTKAKLTVSRNRPTPTKVPVPIHPYAPMPVVYVPQHSQQPGHSTVHPPHLFQAKPVTAAPQVSFN